MRGLIVAARIAVASSVALGTVGTALTTLLLVPLLEVVLLAAAATGLTGGLARDTAYSTVIVAFGVSVIGGTVNEVTRDRTTGVLGLVLRAGLARPAYWCSKVLVPVVGGTVTAGASLLAIGLLDPAHDVRRLGLAALAAAAACLSGALVGVAVSILSLGTDDPYVLSNALQAVALLGTGVVLPLAQSPEWLSAVARLLPFTSLVEGFREERMWNALGGELLLVAAWLAASLLAGRAVLRRWRSGAVREQLW